MNKNLDKEKKSGLERDPTNGIGTSPQTKHNYYNTRQMERGRKEGTVPLRSQGWGQGQGKELVTALQKQLLKYTVSTQLSVCMCHMCVRDENLTHQNSHKKFWPQTLTLEDTMFKQRNQVTELCLT